MTIAKLLNQNFFRVPKLPLTALGCYDTNARHLNNKLLSRELKILNYDGLRENKKPQMKINASIGENRFMDVNW